MAKKIIRFMCPKCKKCETKDFDYCRVCGYNNKLKRYVDMGQEKSQM